MVGVPGPIDLRTEIAIPSGTLLPPGTGGKIVLHNDPSIDETKAWPWEAVRHLARAVRPEQVVLLGGPGPELPGVHDLRGRTTLAEAAAIIRAARCYVGIDSGLMWVAGSLQVPTVGLYGTSYIPAYSAIQPRNPHAVYLQTKDTLEGISVDDVLAAVRGRDGTAVY
jgi:ADP-heptose:LPS heptosyltransferase